MTTRHRKRMREAAVALEQHQSSLVSARARFAEVGRAISASNEEKLRKALSAIDDVLKALDSKETTDEAKEARARAVELVEGMSSAADDATDGAYVLAMLLDIMGDEADEPDDLAVLQVAYQALTQWLAMEVSEIGTPDDTTNVDDMGMEYSALSMAARSSLSAMSRLQNSALTVDVSHHNEDESVDADACLAAIAAMNDGTSPVPESDRAAAYQHLAAHLKDAGVDAPALTEAWRATRARLKLSGALRARRTSVLREATRITTELLPLKERAVKEDGSVRVKLIQPGWGSTGYYAPDVLERDGPNVFKAGTKMFWDHSTLTEDFERPERSLRDLAGEFTTDASWDPNGPEGAGLYSDAKVFAPYRETLNEIAPSIGVSIVAYGKAESGTAEGKSGQIINELVAADSVDFVTTPGAGGRVLSLFEAARQSLNPTGKEVVVVEVEKDPKFIESEKRRAKAEEQLVGLEAHALITEKLNESSLPEPSQARLLEVLRYAPPAKNGELDKDAMTKRIDEAVTNEVEFIAKLTEAGTITGMGATTATREDAEKGLQEAFERLTPNKEAAKVAAAGRRK